MRELRRVLEIERPCDSLEQLAFPRPRKSEVGPSRRRGLAESRRSDRGNFSIHVIARRRAQASRANKVPPETTFRSNLGAIARAIADHIELLARAIARGRVDLAAISFLSFSLFFLAYN